ncbi:thaumatin family protein, partial [Legionella pneumophila]
LQWSGNISASTLCNGTTCQQAACGNAGGTTSCAPGIGFTQPATQAEITMNLTTSDSYDVEVINGFHIPISMQPIYYKQGLTTI